MKKISVILILKIVLFKKVKFNILNFNVLNNWIFILGWDLICKMNMKFYIFFDWMMFICLNLESFVWWIVFDFYVRVSGNLFWIYRSMGWILLLSVCKINGFGRKKLNIFNVYFVKLFYWDIYIILIKKIKIMKVK